jgi:hypothetical protein
MYGNDRLLDADIAVCLTEAVYAAVHGGVSVHCGSSRDSNVNHRWLSSY